MDYYEEIGKLQNIKKQWQDFQHKDREILWRCRQRLKELPPLNEREEIEQAAFNTLQRLQRAMEHIERIDESIAELKQQEKDYPERTNLGTIVLICIFFLLVVFLLTR